MKRKKKKKQAVAKPLLEYKPPLVALFQPAEVSGIGRVPFRVGVLVKATRRAYGREEFLVGPQVGNGSAWVRGTSLLFIDRSP
jgi:hypothetical protein